MIVTDYPEIKPNLLYRNKHFSTIAPSLFRKHTVIYTRKRITTPDTDFFNVDCILRNNKRAVVLLHGLEGSSNSQYIKGFANLFANQQYDIHALNFRGCGGESNLLPSSYHSGFTADLKLYIEQILPKYSSIYLIGFSLGGNVMLKYLAEYNNTANIIKAAAVVSVPVDLKGAAMELDNGFNRVYMQRFINSLSKKILAKSKQFPQQIDIKGLHSIKNFKQFDDRYTAPLHGFANAEEYWSKCSSINNLNTINTPTLFINSRNDPFLSASCFPYDEIADHPFLHGIFTNYGGHVGFMLNSKTSWLEPVVYSFFQEG
ncbi:MAG: alpha/beta fold hydrolase [Bacteroidia bacterium]|nr:alpha/beta fold hydrolase [Bacteroidia bacterium]